MSAWRRKEAKERDVEEKMEAPGVKRSEEEGGEVGGKRKLKRGKCSKSIKGKEGENIITTYMVRN